jgi:hypothetical protein
MIIDMEIEKMKELFTEEEYRIAICTDKLRVKCCECDKEFLRAKSEINRMRKNGTGKYCSSSCAAKYRRIDRVVVTCKECNKEIEKEIYEVKKSNNDFCSRSCAIMSLNSRVNLKVIKCLNCGSETKNKEYCSVNCGVVKRWKIKVEEIEQGRIKGIESNIRRHIKRYLIEKNGHQCERCTEKEWMGEPIPLNCDHIDGRSENNELSNFRLICANCDRQQPTYGSKNRGKGRKSRRKNKNE